MKKSIKSIIFTAFIFITAAFSVNAQTVVRKVSSDLLDYKVLKNAQNAYEANDWGKALSLAEQAKESRKQECNYKIYVLENLQRYVYVRKAGDDLQNLMATLKEHTLNEAYDLIASEVDSHGMAAFNSSYSGLLSYIKERTSYPEADYLIAKIFRMEGESKLAENYYLEAYNHSSILDVPDQKYEILYDLADLCQFTGNMQSYEKYLLLVMKDNKYYTNTSFMRALTRLVKENRKGNLEQFLKLYRCEGTFSIKALGLLTKYYLDTKDYEKALNCASLGTVTCLTRIAEILSSRMTHYTYSTFQDLLVKSQKYSDITQWGNNNGVWELMFNFGETCQVMGYSNLATEMFTVMARSVGENYWQTKALFKLSE